MKKWKIKTVLLLLSICSQSFHLLVSVGCSVCCLFVCLFVCLLNCIASNLWVNHCIQSFFSFVKNRSCMTQIYITKIAAKCILVVVVKWRHRANVLFRWNQMRKLALKTREPCCDVRERTSVTSWSTLFKLTKFSYLKASGDTICFWHCSWFVQNS